MPSLYTGYTRKASAIMMPFEDFPPDLNTPFNDMVGYIMRVTTHGDSRDYDYIRSVAKTFHAFDELPIDDIRDVIALAIRYGYFDQPMSRLEPVDDEFISLSDLLDGVARANGLGGYAND